MLGDFLQEMWLYEHVVVTVDQPTTRATSAVAELLATILSLLHCGINRGRTYALWSEINFTIILTQ